MTIWRVVTGSAFLAVVATAGCSSAPGPVDDLGVARVALTTVPADARCLRITAQGSRQVVKSFDLSPGTAPSFELAGLPFGDVQFSGDVFDAACNVPASAAAATWVSEPVTATVAKGVVAQVMLVMRRNGRSSIAIDFSDCAEGLVDLGSLSNAWDVNPIDMNELGQVVGTTGVDAFLWEAGQMRGLGLGAGATVLAINNNGQILARDPDYRPVLWRDAVASRIEGLDGNEANVAALNDAGQVVGQSATADGTFHAMLWQAGAGTVDLGTLGGANSHANGINRTGQVVGGSDTSADQHAFLWDGGALRDVGTLGGGWSDAVAINDNGQIIGSAAVPNGDTHAFLWSGGSMWDLGTLGDNWSSPVALGPTGQVVGLSSVVAGDGHAFLWDDGLLRDLGTLGGSFSEPGGLRSINDAGEIVGAAETALGETHAFFWNGVMHDLGSLGIPGTRAVGTNRAHQIFGFSYTNSGRQHGFFFDPSKCPVAPN